MPYPINNNIGETRMIKIFYNTKNTKATTTYIELTEQDKTTIFNSLLSINAWMQELSVSKDKDIKDFTKWFSKSDKKFLYNNKLKAYNSPQSVFSGLLNNLMFGSQRDLSLTQLDLLQDLNNTLIDVIEVIIEEKNIQLQETPKFVKFWAQENLWNA